MGGHEGREWCIGLKEAVAGWEGLEEAAGVGRELVLGNHQVMVVEHQASPGPVFRLKSFNMRLPQGLCSEG